MVPEAGSISCGLKNRLELMRKNEDKALAVRDGRDTYTGSPCCHCEGTLRGVRHGSCVGCKREYHRGWQARWRETNPEAAKARGLISRIKDPEGRRRSVWRAKGQPEPRRPRPELCENCEGRNGNGKVLSNDHCHKTGWFRGWLCNACNTGIGLLGDSMEALERALLYLRRADADRRTDLATEGS